MLSHTERIARSLLAHYHPELKQTHGHRPNWLKNPETGKNLEIDIWFAGLQAGVEVQGSQHGRPIDGLQAKYELVPKTAWQRFWRDRSKYRVIEGSTKAGFEKQQRHDKLKVERCAEYGVRLYHLTIFDLTEVRFQAFLRKFEQDNRLLPNRYVSRPAKLFVEAERLSRRKIKPAIPQSALPPSWQKAWDWLKD